MKNVHVIPTDKPSRLFIDIDDNKLKITVPIGGEHMMNQHIYITSDEEIKDCWVLNTHTNEVYFLEGYYGIQPITKKIILTDDKDLIADGVQAIDDTFLEWFVKNPSCEKVEVDSFVKYNPIVYQIILPKPKQETLEEAADMLFDNVFGQTMNIQWAKEKAIELAKWQQERMYSEEEVRQIINSFEKLCYNYQSNKDWFPSKKSEWFKQFKKK